MLSAYGGSGASSLQGGGGGCAPLQRLPPPSSSSSAAAAAAEASVCRALHSTRSSSARHSALCSSSRQSHHRADNMREIVHLQAGQCGNQIGAKVSVLRFSDVCMCAGSSPSMQNHSVPGIFAQSAGFPAICRVYIFAIVLSARLKSVKVCCIVILNVINNYSFADVTDIFLNNF